MGLFDSVKQRAVAQGTDELKAAGATQDQLNHYADNFNGTSFADPAHRAAAETNAIFSSPGPAQFHTDTTQAQRSYYGGSPLGMAMGAEAASQNGVMRQNVLDQLGQRYGAQANAAAGQSNQIAAGYGQQAQQAFANQQQARAQTLGAVDQLRNYYQQGPGPSQAQALLQQGSDAAMAQNLALARSGRGAGGNAEAMRAAMFQNAAQQQQLGQQQSALSAQEAATWRGQQLQGMGLEQQALSGIRGQDLSAYGQGQSGQLGFGNQAQSYMGMGQQAQGALTQAAMNQGQAGDALRAQILGQQLSADQSTNLANAQLQQQANMANANYDYNAWAQQQNAAIQKYGIDKGIGIQSNAQNMQMMGAALQGVGTLGAAAVTASDERTKTDIRDDVFDLRPARGYSYEYKDPSAPGRAPGRHFGPMAQDLEKTPAGRSVIRRGADGMRMVDTSRLSLVNTGAIAELQKKHDDLASELARIAGGRR